MIKTFLRSSWSLKAQLVTWSSVRRGRKIPCGLDCVKIRRQILTWLEADGCSWNCVWCWLFKCSCSLLRTVFSPLVFHIFTFLSNHLFLLSRTWSSVFSFFSSTNCLRKPSSVLPSRRAFSPLVCCPERMRTITFSFTYHHFGDRQEDKYLETYS